MHASPRACRDHRLQRPRERTDRRGQDRDPPAGHEPRGRHRRVVARRRPRRSAHRGLGTTTGRGRDAHGCLPGTSRRDGRLPRAPADLDLPHDDRPATRPDAPLRVPAPGGCACPPGRDAHLHARAGGRGRRDPRGRGRVPDPRPRHGRDREERPGAVHALPRPRGERPDAAQRTAGGRHDPAADARGVRSHLRQLREDLAPAGKIWNHYLQIGRRAGVL